MCVVRVLLLFLFFVVFVCVCGFLLLYLFVCFACVSSLCLLFRFCFYLFVGVFFSFFSLPFFWVKLGLLGKSHGFVGQCS